MLSKTSDEYRAEAERNRKLAEESFQRCDTDGFLSQWALGLSAQKASLNASIADNGGKALFIGLYRGDERILAKIIDGQFGRSWYLLEPIEGRRFIPFTGFGPHAKKSRVQKALGLCERLEEQDARAAIVGSGHGLSGNAWVTTVRSGDQYGRDAVLRADFVDWP